MVQVGQQPGIHGQILVALLGHQPFGLLQRLLQGTGDLDALFGDTGDLRQPVGHTLGLQLDGRLVDAHTVERLVQDASAVGQQRPDQMGRLHFGVFVVQREADTRFDRFGHLVGQFFKYAHSNSFFSISIDIFHNFSATL